MEMLKKIQLGIFSILLIIGIAMVGTPGNENIIWLNCIYCLIGLIYIVYQYMQEKDYQLLGNVLDVAVFLLLMICPWIPVITGTYISMEKCALELYKMVSIFAIYILIRDMVKKDPKNMKFVWDTLLIGGLVLGALGIEHQCSNKIYRFLSTEFDFLELKRESYMVSAFGYKNAFGIYMGMMFLLSLYYIKTYPNTKLEKIIYTIMPIFFLICLLWSQSMFSIAILAILLMTYIFLKSSHKKRILKILAIGMVIIGIIFAFLFFFVFRTEDVYTFDGKEDAMYTLSQIQPNQKYLLEFDVENTGIQTYKIRIREQNESRRNEKDEVLEIEGNYSGKLNYELQTGESAKYVLITFLKNMNAKTPLVVKKATINGESIVLKYKFLPSNIVRTVQKFTFKSTAIEDRAMMIRTGIRLGMKQPVWGQGAEAWLYRADEVQEWKSNAKYVHSYPVDIFIQYGIIGVIVLATVIAGTIQIWKNQKEKSLLRYTVFGMVYLVLLHSLIDVDMEYYCMVLTISILLAVISSFESKISTKLKKQWIGILAMIIIAVITLGTGIHTAYLITKDRNIRDLLFYKSSFGYEAIMDKAGDGDNEGVYRALVKLTKKEKYRNLFAYYMRLDYDELSKKQLDYVYDYICEHSMRIDYDYNLTRNQLICQIIEEVAPENKKQFAEIIVRENDEMIARIKNYKQSGKTVAEIENQLKTQKKHYDLARQYIDN